MEKQNITAKNICDALGQSVIAERLGVIKQTVSAAYVADRFPARWYPVIRDMCNSAGISCPESAFTFITWPRQLPRRADRSRALQ